MNVSVVLASQNSLFPSLSTGKRCRCCVILMVFSQLKSAEKNGKKNWESGKLIPLDFYPDIRTGRTGKKSFDP